MTTGREYKTTHKLLLGLLSTSHFGHYLLGGLLLTAQVNASVVIALYLIRMISLIILYGKILKKLRDPSMLIWIPILDATFVLFYVVFAPFLIDPFALPLEKTCFHSNPSRQTVASRDSESAFTTDEPTP